VPSTRLETMPSATYAASIGENDRTILNHVFVEQDAGLGIAVPEDHSVSGRARHRGQGQSMLLPARTSFLRQLATTMRARPGLSEA